MEKTHRQQYSDLQTAAAKAAPQSFLGDAGGRPRLFQGSRRSPHYLRRLHEGACLSHCNAQHLRPACLHPTLETARAVRTSLDNNFARPRMQRGTWAGCVSKHFRLPCLLSIFLRAPHLCLLLNCELAICELSEGGHGKVRISI